MKARDLSLQIIEVADNGLISTFLEMTNRGHDILRTGWRLYFSLGLTLMPSETRLRRKLIEGRYGYLEPGPGWTDIKPGGSIRVPVKTWLFSGMPLAARQGFHLAERPSGASEETLLGTPELLAPQLAPLTAPRNERITQISPSANLAPLSSRPSPTITAAQPAIIPAVKKAAETGRTLSFPGFYVVGDDIHETARLKQYLHEQALLSEAGGKIELRLNGNLRDASYRLTTDDEGVSITAGKPASIFHGLQTLRQLTKIQRGGCHLPEISITDQPDFDYRGLFLDLARHFRGVPQIRKTIQAMAAYKMNVLQLGISNDEGWRLEIPSVPELTGVGSLRSHKVRDEAGKRRALYPAWGDNHEDTGGYIRADEFVELLQYARQFHIDIVPEFNLPGHCNALLRSLDDNPAYQLVDPDDKSNYRSAQGYTHNVLNVGLADSYQLAKTILADIKSMYTRAEVPLLRIHLGGDEVPFGAWLHSPACHRLPVWRDDWNPDDPDDAQAATAALMKHHYEHITRVAREVIPGVETGFWHEMSPYGDEASYFNGWMTENEGQLAREILHRNQKLIIANASFLYLDMPYAPDAQEPGLPWAGYIDTEMIYKFDPAGCWAVSEGQQKQVSGLQAQLWSETIFSASLMDYHLFPRLLAVAERGWNASPSKAGWPAFLAALREREMAYLGSLGVDARPLP